MSDPRPPASAQAISIAEIRDALGTRETVSPVSEVAERLLGYFTSGRIAAGTRLPSERTLSTSLGVGRSAVREALAALEILGIVVVRPGSGTYLRDGVSELLPRTLSWGMMLGAPRTRDLVQLRGGLEALAVRGAVEGMNEEHVQRLSSHLDAMRAARGDLGAFVEADALFHAEIAEGSGNQVLAELLASIRSLLRVWSERAVHDEGDAARAIEEHAAVFDAIRLRDTGVAEAAMAAHMTTAAVRLLADYDAAGEPTA